MVESGEAIASDVVQWASQLGRLDFLSALLALIGIALVLGGIFAFINFRATAKRTAKEEAESVAKGVAEQVANAYMQDQVPVIIREYRVFYGVEHATEDSDADRIAEAQDDGG